MIVMDNNENGPDSLTPEREELEKLSDDELVSLLSDYVQDSDSNLDDEVTKTLILNILRTRDYSISGVEPSSNSIEIVDENGDVVDIIPKDDS